MAQMLPIHEYEIDRATSRLELIRHNPTRSIAIKTTRGTAFISWQNGKWYDTGYNEIADPTHAIPPDLVAPEDLAAYKAFLDGIKNDPPTGQRGDGPVVTSVCKICGDVMNESELNDHAIAHYRELEAQQRLVADAVPPAVDKLNEPKLKHDANTVGRR